MRYLIFILSISLVTPVFAQKRPKRTTINFEDQLIRGASQKPDLLYMLQKKDFNYKRLIRLRENFLPEMRNTSSEIESATVKKKRRKRGSK